MRLAILDNEDNVLVSWPSVAAAHDQLAHEFAAKVEPGRWRARRRAKLANQMVGHLLDLQRQTTRI